MEEIQFKGCKYIYTYIEHAGYVDFCGIELLNAVALFLILTFDPASPF